MRYGRYGSRWMWTHIDTWMMDNDCTCAVFAAGPTTCCEAFNDTAWISRWPWFMISPPKYDTIYYGTYYTYIYIYCGKDSPHEIDIYLLIFLWHDLKRFEEGVGFSVWWPVSICFLQNRWLQQGLTRTTWLISPRCIMCIDSGPQIHPKGVASTISADLFSRAHAALKKRSQWSHRAEKPMLRKS